MKRFLLAAAAALAVAACSDGKSSPTGPAVAEPAPPSYATGDIWTIFTNQTPASDQGFTGSGWEVGTRFYSTVSGCVIGFRFWRSAFETGSNTVTLWTNSGTSLRSRVVASSGSGWKELYLYHPFVDHRVFINANTYYRISATTNTGQVKTFGAFTNGPITNGPLAATSGYYGQPTGTMPATASDSNFFVDVIFEEGPSCP